MRHEEFAPGNFPFLQSLTFAFEQRGARRADRVVSPKKTYGLSLINVDRERPCGAHHVNGIADLRVVAEFGTELSHTFESQTEPFGVTWSRTESHRGLLAGALALSNNKLTGQKMHSLTVELKAVGVDARRLWSDVLDLIGFLCFHN